MILFDLSPLGSGENWSPRWQDAAPQFSARWQQDCADEVLAGAGTSLADAEDGDPISIAMEEAWAAGFVAGQARFEKDECAKNVLASAIAALAAAPNPAMEAVLAQIIHTLVSAIVDATPTSATEMQKWVAQSLQALPDDVHNAAIMLHPDDAAFLRETDLPDGISLQVNPAIAIGSVRIAHQAGAIDHGRAHVLALQAAALGLSGLKGSAS
jgi:flagellar biosynthesis/type III secretory pathway protein FliH